MNKIYYTYILTCNDGSRYCGHTDNLKERLKDHRQGRVRYTKNKHPQLVFFEEHGSRSEAFRSEMRLKNGETRKSTIDKLINSFPKAKCQGFNSQTP